MQLDRDVAVEIREQMLQLRSNVGRVLRGKDRVVEQVLVCLVGGGHVLLEDLPGVSKTTLAYCLARSIDCSFSRIQFTSDLLPGDVIGVSVFNEKSRDFEFRKGPIFSSIVLADEINRTTPKTQSSLLEVMDRAKVTVDGQAYSIETPFMVVATQNPIDFEGTFPLPESQMDRFMMRLTMGYPDEDGEMEILRQHTGNYDQIDLEPVISAETLRAAQALVEKVYVEESLLHYLLRIVHATRTESAFRAGLSTRGLLALRRAVQARALIQGRDFVLPDDVFQTVLPVMTHRLALRRPVGDSLEERSQVSKVLRELIESLPSPV